MNIAFFLVPSDVVTLNIQSTLRQALEKWSTASLFYSSWSVPS